MKQAIVAQQAAEALALRALAWLAAEPDRIGGFLAAAGAGPSEIRVRASDPEFLGFVLDYLLADEAGLVAFAEAEGIRPDLPQRARAALPGGDLPNWT